jgi:hypothetical protein
VRVRLRNYPSAEELADLYAIPHDHTRWEDHVLRVEMSLALCRAVIRSGWNVADLSAGDAAIALGLAATHQTRTTIGDMAPGWQIHGPIEETVERIGKQNLLICSETVEHLADPDAVLQQIRKRTDWLFLSTPLGEGCDGPVPAGAVNLEHVWGWDDAGIRSMLVAADFRPMYYTLCDPRAAGYTYAYQMWLAR